MTLEHFAAIAAVVLSGCATHLSEARPDQAPGDDEVVLVGEVDFDPAVNPPGPPPMATELGSRGMYSHYFVMFGDTAAPNGGWDKADNIDQYGMVTPGRPFALLFPRHRTYLKTIKSYAHMDETTSRGLFGEAKVTINMYVVACLDVLQIPIQPEDRYVFVGHLICKHDEGGSRIIVDPSDDGIAEALPRLIGAHEVVRRIPHLLPASAASSVSE